MHEEAKAKDKSVEKAFKQNMMISVLGIILCMVILCSTTWAWFTANVSSSDNTIKSAYCTVTVLVESEGEAALPTNDVYTLTAGKSYIFTLSATGTAGSAYCILSIDGNDYYTAQIPTAEPGNFITFTLQFTGDTEVEVITRWGTSSKSERAFYNGITYIDLVEATISAQDDA